MADHYFWLSEERFSRFSPLLPNKPRGVPRTDGRRVDRPYPEDRRTLGRCTGGLWPAQDAEQPVRVLGRQRRVIGCVPGAGLGGCADGGTAYRQHGGRGNSARRSAARAVSERRRHSLVDLDCRPVALLLTGGQMADCIAAETLLDVQPPVDLLHGDKGYDSDALRRRIKATSAAIVCCWL